MQEEDQQINTMADLSLDPELEISKRIEAILFWKGESLSKKDILKFIEMDEESKELLSKVNSDKEIAFDISIEKLKKEMSGRGVCLLQIDDSYALRTSPSIAGLIEKLQIEELNKDLGKATTETLSLIIYRGPIRRSDIDNIRGVNSSYILRNLMIRGLIDKDVDPKNSRTNIYKPSFELLSYLGVTNIENLPNYKEVINELNKFDEDFNTKQESAE
ncbi:MAG: SMC-Scp complex subunit ScpB [bacterium]